MSEIKILAGDFPQGEAGVTTYGDFLMLTGAETHDFRKGDIAEISLASEENVKSISGNVGLGIAGAAMFGPVGFLAGLLLGGGEQDVKIITFIMLFKDGRKLLATTDPETYTKLRAFAF